MNSLLEVNHLSIFVKQHQKLIRVVKNISFDIQQGECVGIVGESGCGKSLTAQTIACLNPYPFEGSVKLNGRGLQECNAKEKRDVCATQIGLIFQSPQSYLNPTLRVGEQIRENPSLSLTKSDVLNLMKQVGLSDVERCYDCYPHELSGGMCQRVMIAMALARKPKLLIADEPTTALDVTIQAQILDLLQDIQKSTQTSTLLITHDFSVVERLCNRVLVMYAGEIVEMGSIKQVLEAPQHPYTKALLASRPQLGKGKHHPLANIQGRPPKISTISQGCPFAPRCSKPLRICTIEKPKLENQEVACWYFSKEFLAAKNTVKMHFIQDIPDTSFTIPEDIQERTSPLLKITNLSKHYKRRKSFITAVNKLSLDIQSHEILGLVGESGCGKSSLAKMILMLEQPSEGEIFFDHQNLLKLDRRAKLAMRRQIQIVFQNPYNALNPRMTLQQILNEPLDIHHLFPGPARSKRIDDLLEMVGLEKNQLQRYPHQFSGGQLQRICIAQALAVEPRLLVCDEPLSALDLSVQAQIINLLRKCQKDLGLTLLFISHDLAAVDMLADRVAVMHQGEIVEEASSKNIFHQPQHYYTKQLLESATK